MCVLHCLNSWSKTLSELESFPAPQMKICINQCKYSVTAATSPITVEAGQRRGETSDATPENKKTQPQPKKHNITTLAEIQVKQSGSKQQGTVRVQFNSKKPASYWFEIYALHQVRKSGESSTDPYNSRDETQLWMTVKVYFYTPNSFKALIMWPPDDMNRVASSFRCV